MWGSYLLLRVSLCSDPSHPPVCSFGRWGPSSMMRVPLALGLSQLTQQLPGLSAGRAEVRLAWEGGTALQLGQAGCGDQQGTARSQGTWSGSSRLHSLWQPAPLLPPFLCGVSQPLTSHFCPSTDVRPARPQLPCPIFLGDGMLSLRSDLGLLRALREGWACAGSHC